MAFYFDSYLISQPISNPSTIPGYAFLPSLTLAESVSISKSVAFMQLLKYVPTFWRNSTKLEGCKFGLKGHVICVEHNGRTKILERAGRICSKIYCHFIIKLLCYYADQLIL